MSKSKRSTTSPAASPDKPKPKYWLPDRAEWLGFINIRLNDQQKERFRAWFAEHSGETGALMDDMLGQGLKITMSFDHEHNAYVVAVTGNLCLSDPPMRSVCSSRAGLWAEAIALCTWKHYELAKGNYGNYRPRDDSFLEWG